jgi:hypothetical protein
MSAAYCADQLNPSEAIPRVCDPISRQPPRLKNCTARSCFTAAARVLKVPKFRRLPVFGLIFRE